jgi:hypothetical protein
MILRESKHELLIPRKQAGGRTSHILISVHILLDRPDLPFKDAPFLAQATQMLQTWKVLSEGSEVYISMTDIILWIWRREMKEAM